MKQFDFDLFVIGGGSGGVRAARVAGALGKKVALAEEYRMGGTCVIRGCVPKKLFVYASHFSDDFRDSHGYGWSIDKPTFNWKALIAAKDKEISRLEGLYRAGLDNNDVTVFEGRAVIFDQNTIKILETGECFTAEKILIATGGRVSSRTEIKGHEFAISSNEVFDLEELPKTIVINGGGYIAVEFANIFHGLGVETTLIYRGDMILRGFDNDLRRLLSDRMTAKGIRMIYSATIKEIEKGKRLNVTLNSGEKLESDQVMFALGRTPNTEGLGLEKVGVKLSQNGAIKVDDFMKTNVPYIWALGDVTDKIQLTPVAIHEAMCFIQTEFHANPISPDYDLIATVVFSQPEIGTVGMSEDDAVKILSRVEIYRAEFRPMRNILSGNQERMLMKLVVDGTTKIVIGAHILGHAAGEMAQLLGISLKGRLTKDVFDATMAVHPTAAEELVTMYKPTSVYENGIKIEG